MPFVLPVVPNRQTAPDLRGFTQPATPSGRDSRLASAAGCRAALVGVDVITPVAQTKVCATQIAGQNLQQFTDLTYKRKYHEIFPIWA